MILRRLAVAFADYQIVLVKDPVVCFYLAGQSGIVVQVAFDFISGQPVRYHHYITDRSAYALFLIDADLMIGCLQVRNQNIPNGLVVHKCLLWCQTNHSVKYPVRQKSSTGYNLPYQFYPASAFALQELAQKIGYGKSYRKAYFRPCRG